MTTTHTFTTHIGEDDTPVKVTYTHIPAESMTLEYPGCDARIELVCVQPDIGDEQDAALIEKSWEHHEGITQ